MEKLFLTSRRVGVRSNGIACAAALAACVLALILSPSALAAVSTTGDVTPDPTTTTAADSLYVGNTADGSMSIDGGSDVVAKTTYLGYATGVTGSANVDGAGSTLAGGVLLVGYHGDGELSLTNGGVVSGRHLLCTYVATGTASAITVNGLDSLLTIEDSVNFGYYGSSTLVIENKGQFSNGGSGWLAVNVGSDATATVSGDESSWTIGDQLLVGNRGNATLLIQSGGSVSNVTAFIAAKVESTSAVTVTGQGSTWTNGQLIVGDTGTGTLMIDNHGTVLSSDGFVGADAGSHGVVEITGPGSTWTNSSTLQVGSDGNGTMTVSAGGQVNSTLSSYVARDEGSTGLVTITGEQSAWNVINDLHVGYNGNGTLLIQDHGTVSASSARIGDSGYGVGQVTVDGNGSSWNITGGLQIGKIGLGTLNIINGGHVTTATVEIGGNGVVTGDGVLTGNVTSLGSIAPGQSPGTLQIDGDFTQVSYGSLDIELADGINDVLAITGSATLDGKLNVSLFDGFMPSLGQSFTILTAPSLSGAFSTIHGHLISSNLSLAVTYSSTAVTVNAAVPGDANLDGQVNLADLQILGDNWQSEAAVWSLADFTGDGIVNLADLQVIGDHWGYGTSADLAFDEALLQLNGVQVPEPGAMVMLLTGVALLVHRWRESESVQTG